MTYSIPPAALVFESDLAALETLCTLEEILPEPPRITARPMRKPREDWK